LLTGSIAVIVDVMWYITGVLGQLQRNFVCKTLVSSIPEDFVSFVSSLETQ